MNNCTAGETVVNTVCYVMSESTYGNFGEDGVSSFPGDRGPLLRTFFFNVL